MEKTHIEIETNIMGKKCILYMQQYDKLPPRITVTRRGLCGRSPRPLACCPPRKIKFVHGGKVENVKPCCVECNIYAFLDV